MKPRILTTLLICSATLMTTATPAIAAVTIAPEETPQVPTAVNSAPLSQTAQEKSVAPETDSVAPNALIDLGIKGGKLVDSKGQTTWNPVGNPTVTNDNEMTGDVLGFDGKSAFYHTLTDDQLNQLSDGLTIEAYFKYDPNNGGGEHDIFSSQESGGFGLGVENGHIIFYAHDGQGYKKPSTDLQTNRWIHAVGVIDKNKTASLYIDGKLVSTVAMPGNLKFANNTKDLVLGGDARPNTHVQSQMKGKIKSARMYNQTLNANQIANLSETAHKGQLAHIPVDQTVATQLAGPKKVAAGALYGFNVHARQLKLGDPETLSMDVVYNPKMFSYENAERTLGGGKTKVEKIADGRLRISTSATISNADFLYYAKTRLARINLRAQKNISGDTNIQFEQVSKQGTIMLGAPLNVNIQGMNPLDYNGDGIIGIGDVALAPIEKKAAVAAKAEIRPYKHVIVLTTDGGGNPWDPDGIFYDQGNKGKPTWTNDPELMKKRRNTYTMDLFNHQFAMSTSAQSVDPAISAQNYISMLHGLPWKNLPKSYQGTNDTMGQQYFDDFGKATPLFPSVFKVLQENNPTQQAAAFAEWGPIVNAIVEPDAAVKTKQSASLKSFDDVANYIDSPDFQNTSMVYMQSDFMDHQGHSNGWYNDNYWNQYTKYDNLFKTVMDKLESTGHIHDTLVIANADHGGAGHGHGPNNKPNRNIFMALGGETVDSGRRIEGGSNADISALVLNALQAPKAPHMKDSNVFDQSAFLSQTDLATKKRDVEMIKLTRQNDIVQIGLDKAKERKLNAFDMQIDLAGRSVEKISPFKGVQILRKTVENGILKLTVSSDKQTTSELVKIKLKPAPSWNTENVAIKQAMASTTDGTEVLVDLANGNGVVTPDVPSSNNNNGSSTNSNSGNNSNSTVDVDKVISLHGFGKRYNIHLFTTDLKEISGRSLAPGIDLRTDKVMTKNGVKYYRVSTNEWVSEKDAYEYEGVSKILTTPSNKITSLVNSNGEKIVHRALASNTVWATDRSIMINGKLHYRVSTNEFVAADSMRIN